MSSAFLQLIINVIDIYILIVVAWVIASWLQAFGVINTRNPIMANIMRTLHALVAPAVRPIQRIIPSIGGLDFSPIILFLGLGFIRNSIINFSTTGSIL